MTAGAGQQVTIGVVEVAAAPAQRRDDRVEPLVELVNSHAELWKNVLVVHAAGWGPKQHVVQYFAVEPVDSSSFVGCRSWANLDHGRAAFQCHEALCRRVDLNRTGDVLELCTLSQRHSRHAFRRAEHLVADTTTRRPIVVRRLAAPGGREPVNWSENLPMHLHYRCLPRDPDQSRGTRPEATRDPGNREEVQWSNRTCDAAGGSRAC